MLLTDRVRVITGATPTIIYSYSSGFRNRQQELYPVAESAAQAGYVSVNGTVISVHKSGYTPFTVDLTGSLKAGSNEIMIKCSNQLDTTMPPVSSDFNKNNGLHDRVYLIESGKLHADMENYGYDKCMCFRNL